MRISVVLSELARAAGSRERRGRPRERTGQAICQTDGYLTIRDRHVLRERPRRLDQCCQSAHLAVDLVLFPDDFTASDALSASCKCSFNVGKVWLANFFRSASLPLSASF